ncbi:hypothetical protein Nepgr_011486 [Nepenthes gracilis]|uniref:Uncharacterized protein n=1 Tax=Nepenthes gracilis TaxID=150966 RepID=A0AAD3XMD4_NEPGR|nr:hypothetical protein Nepgr_011486 [Nepenthes gracilis]
MVSVDQLRDMLRVMVVRKLLVALLVLVLRLGCLFLRNVSLMILPTLVGAGPRLHLLPCGSCPPADFDGRDLLLLTEIPSFRTTQGCGAAICLSANGRDVANSRGVSENDAESCYPMSVAADRIADASSPFRISTTLWAVACS